MNKLDNHNQQNYSKVISTTIDGSDLVTENFEYKNVQNSSLSLIVITAIVAITLYNFYLKFKEYSPYQETTEDFSSYGESSPSYGEGRVIRQKRADEDVEALGEAINKAVVNYEHYVNRLRNNLEQVANEFARRTKNEILSDLYNLELAGFHSFSRDEKVQRFQNQNVRRIQEKHLNEFRQQLKELANKFNDAEQQLDSDFKQIISDFANICRRLRVRTPDMEMYKKAQIQGREIIPGIPNKQIVQGGFLLAGVGLGVVGFAQGASADPLSKGALTKGAVVKGAAVKGAIVKGAVLHTIGVIALPVIGLYVGYNIGKFFDDSEAKEDLSIHFNNAVDDFYRKIIKDIDDQVCAMSSKLLERKESSLVKTLKSSGY